MTIEAQVSSSWGAGILALLIATAGSSVLFAAEDTRSDEVETAPRAAEKAPDGFVERGEWLFARNCRPCHNQAGKGGIPNENYEQRTIPALAGYGAKLKLDGAEVKEVMPLLRKASEKEILDAGHRAVANWFKTTYEIIRDGKGTPKRKDPRGPVPPLQMKPWSGVLNDADIRSLMGYVLSLPPYLDDR